MSEETARFAFRALLAWPHLAPEWRAALARAGHAVERVAAELGRAFHWLAAKTGFPTLLVAAAVLVVALRLARKMGRLAIEFVIAMVALLVLQKLGWMRW